MKRESEEDIEKFKAGLFSGIFLTRNLKIEHYESFWEYKYIHLC